MSAGRSDVTVDVGNKDRWIEKHFELVIALFLFGIAALIRGMQTRYVITGVATVVMVVATIISIVVVSTPVA